jgi:predicted transglutaminase-like cysteine proteinase
MPCKPLQTRSLRYLLLLISLSGTVCIATIPQQRTVFGERYGAVAVTTKFDPWQSFMNANQALQDLDKLKKTNDYLNRAIRYGEDSAIWDTSDYWATPLESLGRGLGDCEDYAIAKYFTLRQIGVAEDKLRFVYVKAQISGAAAGTTVAHMVLAYFAKPDAMPLILDNLIPEVRPANERPDLTPVFSFNMSGIFAGPESRPSSSVERLSRWKDLILRMRAEGFDV